MRRALELMQRTGTSVYVDFREEGIRGVSNLREASAGMRLKGVVLGRPSSSDSPEDEIAELLTRCDGLAFSAISDWPFETLEMASGLCAESGKLFALHASEARREDIDTILSLGPDFVVHMTAASQSDIAACADAEVPVVVCPRSNESFGLDPGIPRLMRLGVSVALGTDNAMLNEPNMISEIRAAFSLSARTGGVSKTQAVCLATYSGHKVLNPKGKITTELSTSDDLVVIDVQGEDPLLELVSPNGSADVYALISDRIVRRTRDWTA